MRATGVGSLSPLCRDSGLMGCIGSGVPGSAVVAE